MRRKIHTGKFSVHHGDDFKYKTFCNQKANVNYYVLREDESDCIKCLQALLKYTPEQIQKLKDDGSLLSSLEEIAIRVKELKFTKDIKGLLK